MRKHIDSNWFETPLQEGEDPWVLETHDPFSPHHRDACIGNGLVGTRVSIWGDASGYTPGSTSFMAGLWGKATDNPERPQGLVELPHWATLTLSPGDRELRRPAREISNYHQRLDTRTAMVKTEWTETGVDGPLQQTRSIWLARGHAHIAVLEAGCVVDEQTYRVGRVFAEETLDSMRNVGVSDAKTAFDGDDAVLSLNLAPFGRRLVIRSRLLAEGDVIREQRQTSDRVLRRRVWIKAPKGASVKVRKVVAIVSDKQHADPDAEAKRQLGAACADLEGVWAAHTAAWQELWQGRVESDHPRLQQLANLSLFSLYNTLRDGLRDSHGPCGLFGNGWDNNVFWDTDLWTHPALTLFRPGIGKSVAAYRYDTLAGARRNAEAEGEVGARYGWQSGETGDEACSMKVFSDERHIVSCVAMGQWLYAVSAGDTEWLRNEGLEVFKGCAEYWAGKAEQDPDGRYHIRQVCGSDEHAGYVDDNATTNWGATWTLRKAAELMREAGETPPPIWEEVAEGLVILMDEERGIPLQMEQWQHGQVIKQADTTMLVHPWHYPMEAEMIQKTVDYYRAHYQDQPIMMGFAIDGILDCRLGREPEVTRTLENLLAYFRPPYLVNTEAPTNERLLFVTGLGGFLQFLAMGMAGLITDEREALRSAWSCLPEGVNRLVLHGVHHGGTPHRVEVTRSENGTASTVIEAG